MAEAFLNQLAGDRFEAESAGLEAGTLNPLAIEVMGELGMDISRNRSKEVFEFIKAGKLFHYVITVCDETSGNRCPIFPGYAKRLHWNFSDPSDLKGTYHEQREQTKKIRDKIKARIESWIKEIA